MWITSLAARILDRRSEGSIKHKVNVVTRRERKRPRSQGSVERPSSGSAWAFIASHCFTVTSKEVVASCPLPVFCLRQAPCIIPARFCSEFFPLWSDTSQNSSSLEPSQISRHNCTSSHHLRKLPGFLNVGLTMCSWLGCGLQIWLLARKVRCAKCIEFIFFKSA